jgi:hypothetical protein
MTLMPSILLEIPMPKQPCGDPLLQVNEFLRSQGKETHKTAVIQSNPDQSKHLETARVKVNGIWIDFVNLRSETYAEDSRIPTMEFGTPEQDALRRYVSKVMALARTCNQ